MTSPDTTDDRASGFDLDDAVPAIVLRGLDRHGLADEIVVAEPTHDQLTRWRQMLFVMARADRNIASLQGATDDELVEYLMARDWSRTARRELDAFAVLCGAEPPTDDKGTEIPRPEAPKEPDRPNPDDYQRDRRDTDPAGDDPDASQVLDTEAYETAVKAWKTRHGQWQKKHEQHLAALAKWEAKWVGGAPTRQQLEQLPPRSRGAVFGYLGGLFMDPQMLAAAATSD
ncbi:hypothetical protein [Microcystis phage Mwe-JY05]